MLALWTALDEFWTKRLGLAGEVTKQDGGQSLTLKIFHADCNSFTERNCTTERNPFQLGMNSLKSLGCALKYSRSSTILKFVTNSL